eukprot:TRINITY_DN2261_c0_g1_i2.p1 TRINITY_DN2261_c0_g1~~TRINITY_DN2261_c0_g1_i2.p1  ORF type:complete len:258 (-),score=112.59 TRINITY_DN2261_c0_g1_i2:72-773(-)
MSGRPTWKPAAGGAHQGGNRVHAPSQQYSSKDLPGHTKLKTRQTGQNTQTEITKRNLKEELEDRERDHFKGKGVEYKPKKEEKNIDADDSDDEEEEEEEEERRRITNGDVQEKKKEESEEEDDDDDDDDDNDEEELLRELEKIKKERAAEQLRKELEAKQQEHEERTKSILQGNPLLLNPQLDEEGDFVIKRKWYDDVVFKNQARTEPAFKKRFINDTIRNDFHKKFLDKYIQ